MRADSKRSLIEGLIFAAALGAAGAALAGLGLLRDARRSSFDAAAISALAKRPVLRGDQAPARDDDLSPVYRLGGKGETRFGLLISFRGSGGSALAAGLFEPDGELEAVELAGASPSRPLQFPEGWQANFLGRGGKLPYPASKAEARYPDVVSGATESFLAAASALERASAAVKASAGAGR